MSLRGSLETVGLPDVLTLLATTRKTGELLVTGDEVEGRLWVLDGQLIASDAGRATHHLDAVFALLRVGTGTFSFDDGGEPAEAGEPTEIAPVLAEAASRLTEWPDIEAAVPSLAHMVSMVPDAPEQEIIVRADQWRLLAATAGGLPVHAVIDAVNLGDFDGSKALKELVEAGLVSMDEPPPMAAPVVEPVVEEPIVVKVVAPAFVEAVIPIEEPSPAIVVAPVEEAPLAVVAATSSGEGIDDGLSFEVVASPPTVPASETSIYDEDGGIDLSPVGSSSIAEPSDNGSSPSWSLDTEGEDEGLTWTNDAAGTNSSAPVTSHDIAAASAAAATWTHEPVGDDTGSAWTDEPDAKDAPAATWTHESGAGAAPAATWTQEPASGAPAAAWTQDVSGNEAVAEWNHEPAGNDAVSAWTQEPARNEPGPGWTPGGGPAAAPRWPAAPADAGQLPQAPAHGAGAGMDNSGFIPSQRASDAPAKPHAPLPGPLATTPTSAPGAEPEPPAESQTGEEEAGDAEEPINRGLLLKFLSSVRS